MSPALDHQHCPISSPMHQQQIAQVDVSNTFSADSTNSTRLYKLPKNAGAILVDYAMS
jgi:hypothetical protein